MYKEDYEWRTWFSSRFLQVDTAYSRNSLMVNVFYHEMKSRDFFIEEIARQKTKIDSAFKAKLHQNENEKSSLEIDSSINTISKS